MEAAEAADPEQAGVDPALLDQLHAHADRLRREVEEHASRPALVPTRKSSDEEIAALQARADRLRRELSEQLSPAKPAKPKTDERPRRQPVYHPPTAGERQGDEIRVERSGVSLADIHGDTARGGLRVSSEEKDEDGEVTRREYTLPGRGARLGRPPPAGR